MVGDRTSVFAMVNSVLAESREKLASDSSFGLDKTASAAAQPKPSRSADSHKVASKHTIGDLNKLADACDHLAKNIHLVNDDRTPQEKLAEYSAIHNELRKQAFSVGGVAPKDPDQEQPSGAGDEGTGPHQTEEAPPDSQSPKTVPLDSSGTGVGGKNAIPSAPAMTPGGSPLQGGDSGEAAGAHQSPKSVNPNEKPQQFDAADALETNQEMMMPAQPDDVLKQASMRKKAMVLMAKARRDGVPPHVARAMLKVAGIKVAEDALNPAQISAGTEPELQSEPGVPSQLMQGSEAGSNTPRETAPTSGEGAGRDLLSSNEAAMNATKRQAKQQNKGALSELLTEPAMSSATDKTLEKSLDNTSSAGVKISSAQANAARELLRKFASSSPGNRKKVLALAKLAQDPDMAAGGGSAPAAGGELTAPPDDEAPSVEPGVGNLPPPDEEQGAEEGAVSDEALEAAKAGVTPEEVAEAEQLLAAQGEAAAAAEEEAAPSPEAGGKESNFGSPMGGGMGMGSGLPMT